MPGNVMLQGWGCSAPMELGEKPSQHGQGCTSRVLDLAGNFQCCPYHLQPITQSLCGQITCETKRASLEVGGPEET